MLRSLEGMMQICECEILFLRETMRLSVDLLRVRAEMMRQDSSMLRIVFGMLRSRWVSQQIVFRRRPSLERQRLAKPAGKSRRGGLLQVGPEMMHHLSRGRWTGERDER